MRAKSKRSCLSTHLFPFASPTNHCSIDPSLQTSIKIKTGWHCFSHCFQSTPTGIYHWLLCNGHINKCQCPSQEHWDRCKPRLQSYCVLSLRILERMPVCLPVFHLENVGVCGLHSLCMTELFDLLMGFCRSLGPENLLLKGATLKNTQKICGKWNLSCFITITCIIRGSLLSKKVLVFFSSFSFSRCCSLHWHGDKDGAQLPGQVSETLCCGEVSLEDIVWTCLKYVTYLWSLLIWFLIFSGLSMPSFWFTFAYWWARPLCAPL